MKKINSILRQENLTTPAQTDLMIPLVGADKEIINRLKFIVARIANKYSGGEYQFTEHNKPILDNLIYYFLGHAKEYDLNKGIALVGDYGCGKSTIFNIFHEFLRTVFPFNKNLFRICSIEDIIEDSAKSDFMSSPYINNVKVDGSGSHYNKPIHILLNEFGHVYNIKKYGTDVNQLIEMFIMKRYDIFQQNGKLTHITTNYFPKQLENHYHPKVVDRFREMFNIIELKGESLRK
jgi:hypothetical protein